MEITKPLENKILGFEKKNGHHYYIGWDEIYEGIICFTNSIFIRSEERRVGKEC